MISTYLRSSYIGTNDMCELKFFISSNLGYPDLPNKKALWGTIAHKALEVLAAAKKAYQEKQCNSFEIEDDALGLIQIDWDELNKPYSLSNEEIDFINKSRLNKAVYCWDVNSKIEYKTVIHGYQAVNTIIEKSYERYAGENPTCDWQPIDRKHVKNFTWMALCYKNGMFDPRRRNILAPEIRFDIEIKKPWAQYEYYIGDKVLKGNLAIKGTIDLVTQVNGGIEIVDWKTGARKNWATDQVKDYKKLCNDKQLMLYYYAARHVFPDIHNIMLTIFFVRDGGPFTVCFGDEDMDRIEEMIRVEFTKIKNNNKPKMVDPNQNDKKCKNFCTYFKTKMEGMNTCKFIHNEIDRIGLEKVIQQYKAPNFDFNVYQAPGE